jgi:hypothetical protein
MAEAARSGIAIQYLGFRDVKGRREYELHALRGHETRRYTVWIELASFSKGRVLLQDGPDVCYQKLLHALADPDPKASNSFEVTAQDLAAHRAAHTPPARRGGFWPRALMRPRRHRRTSAPLTTGRIA